jgi:p-aminobenzoyl-glutamate transporter AbgT
VRETSHATYVVLASALLAAQAAEALLSYLYFRGPPMLLSLMVMACLLWGIIASATAQVHVLHPSPTTPE